MSIMIIISIIMCFFLIISTYILNKRSYDNEKLSQYECGLENFEEELTLETREKFYIKFYIIAIIFLIFDLESILLYPVTLLFNINNTYNIESILNISWLFKGYLIFIFFMSFLILGLLYETKKNVIYQ